MKADVQYNDFKGTVAADIADAFNLTDFLNRRGIDTERFNPIGTKFYPHYSGDGLTVSAICLDKTKDTKEGTYIVEIELSGPIEFADYFNLFKRFQAVVVEDYYQQFDIRDFIREDELGEGDE